MSIMLGIGGAVDPAEATEQAQARPALGVAPGPSVGGRVSSVGGLTLAGLVLTEPSTVVLAVDRGVIAAGENATLTATVDQPLQDTASRLDLVDMTTATTLKTCTTGLSCSVATSFKTGGPHEYEARVGALVSQRVTVERAPWTVTLTGTNTSFAAGEKFTLSATPNQDIMKSGYLVFIVDAVSGAVAHRCGPGWNSGWAAGSCTLSTYFGNGPPRTYRAVVAYADSAAPNGYRDIQATSNDVTTERDAWAITLEADRTVHSVGERFVLTARPNQDIRSAPFRIYIVEDGSGRLAKMCTSTSGLSADGSCALDYAFYFGAPSHTYRAYVAARDASQPLGFGDVQAQSNDVVVARAPWTVDLTASSALVESGKSVTLRATANQDVMANTYSLSIVDVTLGYTLRTCGSGRYALVDGSCVYTATVSGPPHVYRAYVAMGSYILSDVQAISTGYSFPNVGGPTLTGEMAGGYNPSEVFCQRCDGDPVNTTTGEFYETATDLDLPSVGPDLTFGRSFGSSRAAVDGPLGFGWSMALGMRLVPQSGSTIDGSPWVEVFQENGSTVRFARDGQGGFVAPLRVLATLERLGDGTYRFSRHNGEVFIFSATGRLTTLQDRNGNTVSLAYAGDVLTRATSSTGSSVDFQWAGNRLAGVTDDTGRVVTYEYSAVGELVRVTAPDGAVTQYGYDTAHRIVTMTRPDGGVTSNIYGTGARVVKQTDPLGQALTFTYGTGQTTVTDSMGAVRVERYLDGRIVSETRAAGTPLEATTAYEYGPTNHVEAITDPLGRVTRFTYDSRGNRTSVTDPLGRVTTTTFDQFNNPLTVTNPANEIATFTYDERGNPLTATAPDGATTTFTVNADGTVATSTDATGRTTAYTYDAHGFLATATGPDGATVVTSYDSLGRLISSTDPRGTVSGADPADYTSTSTYDAGGRILTTTDPVGAVVTLAYDAAGRPETVTDALGATTTKEYDAAGQLVAVEDALGNRTTMTYDDAGRVLTATDALGATTTNEFDVLGRPVGVTNALGRTSRTEYDAGNRVTATVTPSGARTTYTYDVADQLLTVTDPLGGVTTTTYDAAGRPVTVTDADGRAVTTTYDDAGRPTVVTRADDSTLSWSYDDAGRVLTYTDAAGAATTYTYDAAGRRATATDTAGRTTSYTYGPSGLLDMVTLPDLQTVAYSYDTVGRRTGVDYSDATPDVTYTYDAAGRVTTMVDGIGTTGYTYDALGRTLEIDGPDTTVGYEWDAVGQLTELTYPTGEAVQRAYDDAGQLTSVTDWADREFTYDWSADGQLTELTYPNGIVTSYDYDDAGQVLGITAASAAGIDLLEFAYGYSDAGLMTSQDVTRSAEARAPPAEAVTSAQEYTWDPLGRISTVAGDGAGSFGFDAAGSVTTLAGGRVLTYDAGRQLTSMTSPGGGGGADVTTTFGYDSRGNRVSATANSGPDAGTVEHTYDLADRLTFVVTVAGTMTTYTYSGSGLRASATTGVGEAAVTDDFTWDTLASVPLLLTDSAYAYLYGSSGTPLAQVALDDGAVDYLHTDLLGSVMATTDSTGEVTSETDYDVYGLAAAVVGRVPCTDITRFGYAGEYRDPTGYVYLRARYYDPETALFLTRDPLVDVTGNPYGYTEGNPRQFTDPLGLASGDEWDSGAFYYGGRYATPCPTGDQFTVLPDGQVHRVLYGLTADDVWAICGNDGICIDKYLDIAPEDYSDTGPDEFWVNLGIGLGLTALALTGVGFLVESAALATTALLLGTVAVALDANACINEGNKAACGGAIMGGAGIVYAGAALAVIYAGGAAASESAAAWSMFANIQAAEYGATGLAIDFVDAYGADN